MFTGIIQSVGKLRQEKNILEIEILDNLFDMAIGDLRGWRQQGSLLCTVGARLDASSRYILRLNVVNLTG